MIPSYELLEHYAKFDDPHPDKKLNRGKLRRDRVLHYLMGRANKQGRVWASQARIGEDCGIGKANTNGIMQWLEATHAVYVVPVEHRVGREKRIKGHVYQLTGVIQLGPEFIKYAHLSPSEADHTYLELKDIGASEATLDAYKMAFGITDDEDEKADDGPTQEDEKDDNKDRDTGADLAPMENDRCQNSTDCGADLAPIPPPIGADLAPGIYNYNNVFERSSLNYNNEQLPPATLGSSRGDASLVSETEIDADFAEAVRLFEAEKFGIVSPMVADQIQECLEERPLAEFREALKIAVRQNKRSMAYVTGIYKRWRLEGKNKQGSAPSAGRRQPSSAGRRPAPDWDAIMEERQIKLTPEEKRRMEEYVKARR